MDFDLTEEQRLLQSNLRRLLADHYGFNRRANYQAEAPGWSRAMWGRYAELGLLGLPFAEADGGFGGGPVETMLVAEALGEVLALEPWLSTVVLGGGLLRHGGDAALRQRMVPAIAAGEALLAFAQAEPQSRYSLSDITTTARRDGDGWVLEGRKSVVLHGDTADWLLVTARCAGARHDRGGIGVFLLRGDAPGVLRQGYSMVDGQRGAEITLSAARAEAVLGEAEDGLALVERVVDEAMAALAAEAVGTMSALHAMTLDYLKTRKQFGAPIGSFQVLQHRASDMMVALEQARSMAMYATMMLDEPAAARRAALSAVKVQIGRSARLIGQQAVQMHGGIGIATEYAAGHAFKRLAAIDTTFGDADHHLRALAAEVSTAA
ncbi:pimeloyl-CoA dehydrogenase small subunit [Roseomonas frigidaquae]|uniref:Pimeloyl-CoA dehydrogenase small subunit n=1 Tax=Falsiroseomonas frigidaquae TaxID=487318 RepID=A0ABX1F1P2_9PROT|nr:acyl-CoA dehydrogenase [Falsiroseomonas frigidaquae]NKE46254.1 pimeloyl-CoA dehydrogenase small subunit [Falsiroseomonas frigidaquae]